MNETPWVIATADDAAFWSEETGWVGSTELATRYDTRTKERREPLPGERWLWVGLGPEPS